MFLSVCVGGVIECHRMSYMWVGVGVLSVKVINLTAYEQLKSSFQ